MNNLDLRQKIEEEITPPIETIPPITDISIDPRIVSLFKPSADDFVECQYCKSTNVIKRGYRYGKGGEKQRFRCKDCGHSFIDEDRLYGAKFSPEVIVSALLLSFEDVSYRKIANYLRQNYGTKISHVAIVKWVKKYDYFKPLLEYLKESFEFERFRILGEEQDWVSYSWEETLENLPPDFKEYMSSKIETLEDIIPEPEFYPLKLIEEVFSEIQIPEVIITEPKYWPLKVIEEEPETVPIKIEEVKPTISPDLKEVPTIPTLEAEVEVREAVATEIKPNILELCHKSKLNYLVVRDIVFYLVDRGSVDEFEAHLAEDEGIMYMQFVMNNFEALCKRMNLDTPYKNIKLEKDSRTGIYNLKAM